jgi:hypothetical protein
MDTKIQTPKNISKFLILRSEPVKTPGMFGRIEDRPKPNNVRPEAIEDRP